MEKSNTALSTLKVVTWLCVMVGAVLLIIGFVGHDVRAGGVYSYSTVNVPSYGQLITGASLLGIAFQGWLLLLLFWALQHDRATRASYVPTPATQPKAATPVIPNRAQREAVGRQEAAKVPLAWSEEAYPPKTS